MISGPRRSRTALAVAALLVVAACGLPQTGAPSSPDGSTPSAASLPPDERLTSRIEIGPPPGPTKPFRGEVVHEIQIVGGYATARFVFRNIGDEPITWLNTLYDYEPMQLYQPRVRLEWTDGSQAFATRLGRFFPEPAILQPGEEAVYLMGGRQVNGSGEIGDLVTHIKYCPTRGMDDVPGLPLEVSDLEWETIDGVTTVRGTIRETQGIRRGSSPTIGVALFDADGAFVGAVVADSVGERMQPNSTRRFEISGRGVLGQIAVAAHGSAWVR